MPGNKKKSQKSDRELLGLEQRLAELTHVSVPKKKKKSARPKLSDHKAFFDCFNDWIWESNREGQISFSNSGSLSLFGYSPEELVGKNIADFFPADSDIPTELKSFHQDISKGKTWQQVSTGLLTKSGDIINVEFTAIPVRNQDKISGYKGYVKTVDKPNMELSNISNYRFLHETARKIARTESYDDLIRTVVDVVKEFWNPFGYYWGVVHGTKITLKAASEKLLETFPKTQKLEDGLAGECFLTGKTIRFNHWKELPVHLQPDQRFQSGISIPVGKHAVFQIFSDNAEEFSEEDELLLGLIFDYVLEALKRFTLQTNLQNQGMLDPLTGVYNRAYLRQAAKIEMKRAKRYGHALSILLIGIERFTAINEQLGFVMGDKILQMVAANLMSELRDSDIIFRYSGDHFLVILPETHDDLPAVIERIKRQLLAFNSHHKSLNFPFSFTLGSAVRRAGGTETFEDLLLTAKSTKISTAD